MKRMTKIVWQWGWRHGKDILYCTCLLFNAFVHRVLLHVCSACLTVMCVDLECDVELLMPFFCHCHAYFSLFLVTVIVHLLVCHGIFGVTEQLCSVRYLTYTSFSWAFSNIICLVEFLFALVVHTFFSTAGTLLEARDRWMSKWKELFGTQFSAWGYNIILKQNNLQL